MQLQTEHLTIRPLEAGHWQALRNVVCDFQEQTAVLYDAAFPTEEAGMRVLAKVFAETGLFFEVCEKSGPDMVGYVCFHRDGGSYDMGYCFHSACRGKGYAEESCRALMDWLRREHPVERFTAWAALQNTESVRLLEGLGFTLAREEDASYREDVGDGPKREIVSEGGVFVWEAARRSETEAKTDG